MKIDMLYDGHRVIWDRHGIFKATSGFPGYQARYHQCEPERGPIPEGLYAVQVHQDPRPARDDGTDQCKLAASRWIQSIPRGDAAGVCDTVWSNWGWNRVAVNPVDRLTERACSPRRAGFYLHDSAKGYTHGCIEIEARFFQVLRSYQQAMKHHKLPFRPTLLLRVTYYFETTNGGTRIP